METAPLEFKAHQHLNTTPCRPVDARWTEPDYLTFAKVPIVRHRRPGVKVLNPWVA